MALHNLLTSGRPARATSRSEEQVGEVHGVVHESLRPECKVGELQAHLGNTEVLAALSGRADGFAAHCFERVATAVAGITTETGNGAQMAALRSVSEDEDVGRLPGLGTTSGRPLPAVHRARFEAAFGHDFSQVRVHVGGEAARAAEALHAHAFALGSDVFFGEGEFAPGSVDGDRLLAHELTHVVQHDEGRLPSGGGVSSPTDPAEVEAYANEARIQMALPDAASIGPALVVPADSVAPTEGTAPNSAPHRAETSDAGTSDSGSSDTAAAPSAEVVTRVVTGVTILGEGVSPEAMDAAARILTLMIGRAPAVQKRLQGVKTVLVIVPLGKKLTDLETYKDLAGTTTDDGRQRSDTPGAGGSPGQGDLKGSWVLAVHESQLLEELPPCTDALGTPIAPDLNACDPWWTYGEGAVASHEIGHTIFTQGLSDAQRELIRLHYAWLKAIQLAADATGQTTDLPWVKGAHTASNVDEFIADVLTCFFGFDENHDHTFLQSTDPTLYDALVDIFGAPPFTLAEAVEQKAAEAECVEPEAEAVPPETETAQPEAEPVQRDAVGRSRGTVEDARRGIDGASAALPHFASIQRAFGPHDVSGVRAAVGGPAEDAARILGARAYAAGDAVAFRSDATDLHTAAHEAAHVVQQQRGVVPSGVASPGSRWEAHADQVADAVVAGQSAEPLLSDLGSGGGAASAVQLDDAGTSGSTGGSNVLTEGMELDEGRDVKYKYPNEVKPDPTKDENLDIDGLLTGHLGEEIIAIQLNGGQSADDATATFERLLAEGWATKEQQASIVSELQRNRSAERDPTMSVEEQANAMANQSIDQNLEKYWSLDYENCCIFVLHALQEAGYNLEALVTLPDGSQATVRELVLIHAPSFFKPSERNLKLYAQMAAGEYGDTELEEAYYQAVMMGVVTALVGSGQGTELTNTTDATGKVTEPKLNQLRPGDLFQWWTVEGKGHTTIVHMVKTEDGREFDESTPAAGNESANTVQVAVLGGHTSYRAQGADPGADAETVDLQTKEDMLYTTEYFSPGPTGTGGRTPRTDGGKSYEIESWWAVRPSGSAWAAAASEEAPGSWRG